MEKIPFQITARKKGKTAYIDIVGEIGWQIDSSDFRKTVRECVKDGCTSAHLYINSVGGSVFDANEIANILDDNFENITGDGGAIVASAAAFIATKCNPAITLPSNGQFMTHRPSGGAFGTAKDIEAYLKMINEMDAEYLKVFMEKATDPEGFKKKWESGSDYWMNAEEAKAAGFVSEVRSKAKPDNDTTSMLRASANETIKQRFSEFLTNKNTKMEKVDALLKLPTNATEDDRIKAINTLLSAKTKLEGDLQTANNEKKTLQDKLDDIEAKDKEAKTKEAKTLIAAAVKDGRIDDDENHTAETFWLRNFEADFDGTKAQIERLPKKKNLSDNFQNNSGESAWDKRQKEIDESSKNR